MGYFAIGCLTIAPLFLGYLVEPWMPLGHWGWGVIFLLCLLPSAIYWRREIWAYLSRTWRKSPQESGIVATVAFEPLTPNVHVNKRSPNDVERQSNRHSPDDIQIRGRRTTDPPPWELRTLRSPPMRRLWRADQVRNAIWQSIPPSRRTSPIVFTSPLISSAYAGTGLGRRSSIKLKIFWNKLLGTATSANWNVTYRP